MRKLIKKSVTIIVVFILFSGLCCGTCWAASPKKRVNPHHNAEVYKGMKLMVKQVVDMNLISKIYNAKYPKRHNLRGAIHRSADIALVKIDTSFDRLWRDYKDEFDSLMRMFVLDQQATMMIVKGRAVPNYPLLKAKYKESLGRYGKIRNINLDSAIDALTNH
jgi:hypothetical protein